MWVPSVPEHSCREPVHPSEAVTALHSADIPAGSAPGMGDSSVRWSHLVKQVLPRITPGQASSWAPPRECPFLTHTLVVHIVICTLGTAAQESTCPFKQMATSLDLSFFISKPRTQPPHRAEGRCVAPPLARPGSQGLHIDADGVSLTLVLGREPPLTY